jgi:hypothetical protein
MGNVASRQRAPKVLLDFLIDQFGKAPLERISSLVSKIDTMNFYRL